MPGTSVIGLQWGDEAKGKFVDLLTSRHEIVVRYLGGNNAGHTVVCDGKTFKLSLLPAGILNPDVDSVIATGVVINPKALLAELESMKAAGGPQDVNLRISDRAHVIFPYHMAEEAILEKNRGDSAIGTTMRGIGTCYRDKAGRAHAIRLGEILRPDKFKARLAEIVPVKNLLLRALDPEAPQFDVDEIFEEYRGHIAKLESYITDTTAFLHRAVADEQKILFEGAQGSLLDIDHGTFPYVTSSNSSGCGVHPGSGVPERYITEMIGVAKAYTTRVGGGPCVTELNDDTGNRIRERGREYGTVTGRPRRCGWFDAVATGYSARLSGVDNIALALLDVLDGFEKLKICEAYEINGERTTDFPSHADDLAIAKPIYRTLPGWSEDTTAARIINDLPANARSYIDTVAELCGRPVKWVSVGPDREQTIVVE
ncbi:adenylosuccinate synthase [Stratiformator vulcanicus]|uniref:Adenylosuccinate synthetase n=1 Tax=Stratiformator vulcanicus TaxID=2527980 RepID=A0A517R6E8_9PLAN|nr:Adenylosuccinate synthetase [Stratiformator vulcanicus]